MFRSILTKLALTIVIIGSLTMVGISPSTTTFPVTSSGLDISVLLERPPSTIGWYSDSSGTTPATNLEFSDVDEDDVYDLPLWVKVVWNEVFDAGNVDYYIRFSSSEMNAGTTSAGAYLSDNPGGTPTESILYQLNSGLAHTLGISASITFGSTTFYGSTTILGTITNQTFKGENASGMPSEQTDIVDVSLRTEDTSAKAYNTYSDTLTAYLFDDLPT